jgi:hypothetical protein
VTGGYKFIIFKGIMKPLLSVMFGKCLAERFSVNAPPAEALGAQVNM